jgi:hypothetical protein
LLAVICKKTRGHWFYAVAFVEIRFGRVILFP